MRGVLAEVADQLRVWGHLERARVREVLEVVRNGELTQEHLLLRGVGVGEQLLGLGRQSVEPRLLLGVDDPDRVDVVAAGDAWFVSRQGMSTLATSVSSRGRIPWSIAMLLTVWPKLSSSWASARSGVRSAGSITGPRKLSTLTLSWKEKALLNQLPPEFEQRYAARWCTPSSRRPRRAPSPRIVARLPPPAIIEASSVPFRCKLLTHCSRYVTASSAGRWVTRAFMAEARTPSPGDRLA